MADHGERSHSTWSASATARNVFCPGALTLSRGVPETSSIHADTGTAVHQIAERCLRSGHDADTALDTIEAVKGRQIPVTEEMVNSAQEYIDYCRSRTRGVTVLSWIEERFSLADLEPPFDAGGTGDFVVWRQAERLLEIADLKHGMGVVDIKDNPQLRTYGLGALLKHPDLAIDNVMVTIVQPRAPHKDGRIRSETFSVVDLVEWTADLLASMRRSKTAMDAYDLANGNTVLLEEWRDAWLRPGKCTFCPVEGVCPALRRDALSVAKIWFDDMDQPQIGNSALDTSPEALARDLDMIPMLEDWVKARRAYAHAQAEAGVEIPGYQLSDKIGNRKWADDPDLKLADALAEAGVTDIFVEPKLKSPAQMEKLLGAKRKALIEPFVVREVTGTNLVSVTKTTRPPSKNVAERFFETETEKQ